MSDLSMYELEDIIWDDFDRGDDHIVPHSTNARTTKTSFEGDSCKKPRREATGNSERDTKSLDKKKNMMEKESSSHAPSGVFNPSCDGETVKDKCFKTSYATSAAGDDNSYSYPLTHISQQDDLYNCEGKESGDLLYYGWPDDIGNFEDVDKMLRSCDSSFGLGVTNNDDELGWFTSNQIGGGTEEASKIDFKFPCPEPSALMESCGDLSFVKVNDKKQGFQPVFVGSENDKGGVNQKGSSTEMGSLNVPESSSISSELAEISLEATSFRQLQQVMEQLDMRTKLCIRDSLYRLARSAEQRHNNNNNPSLSRSVTDINDIGGPLMAERSNNGLMDMETDTNPIDRSVAHLLFHRPSESPKEHGSIHCQEESNEK
ncbi:hypothetical protein L2E82_01806 [Cichorium intybus]|uniref:Uncharacterized protein n=1 Tax=Cichorium intybus TaxID=13427 RepID=A0ACB9GZY5_CICIN|nr:hypothetical protein L2E82_01806 [Cichorium intybus]